MRSSPVKPHQIPLYLIKQKKGWDPIEFYRVALGITTQWRAYLFTEKQRIIGTLILADDPLHYAVALQTLVIDKEYRTQERLGKIAPMCRNLALAWARELGRKCIMSAIRPAEKFIEISGCGPTTQIVESVIREEV